MMSKTGKSYNSAKLIMNKINEFSDIVHVQYILLLIEMSCTYHKNNGQEYMKDYPSTHQKQI